MLPAVEAAIEIAELWKKESKPIYIGVGNTHGMTAQFAEMKLNSKNLEQLRKEAAAYDAKLPKCCRCGDILGEKTFMLIDCDDEFCSENCAERAYESMQEDQDEEI
jgi:4-aminobutyrate aminotransferase-like enzyme